MPVLSIIIPVFNMGKYVEKCIRSILKQSFTDYEIIVVDDGSYDDSNQVVGALANQDSRVKCYRFANAGVAAARNRGIKMATGTFIMFIDADDYIGEGYLHNIIAQTSLYNADIYIWGISKVYPNGKVVREKPDLQGCLDSTSFLTTFIAEQYGKHQGLYGYISNKLIRTNIVKLNSIEFNETMNLMEDYDFYLQYFLHCKSFYCFDELGYYYVSHGSNSISPKREHNYLQLIEVQKKCYNLLERKGALTERNEYILKRTIGNFVISSFLEMRDVSLSRVRKLVSCLFEKEYAVDVLQNMDTKKKILKRFILNKKSYCIFFYLLLWNYYLSIKRGK